jgi:branched-chain amino acid transport system permease protein
MIFIGLFLLFNGLSGLFFGYEIKSFPSPFTNINLLKNSFIGAHQLGVILVMTLLLISIFSFFKFTRLGLAMRASAEDPEISTLMGIRSGWMLALGWGFAALIGAVAGMLVAPVLFLDPNMMLSVLTYSFAATVLGGISSPLGTVIGGLIIGILENLMGNYIPFIGNELKLSAVLVLISLVLLIKPSGLFEKQIEERV